jgi:hypothetical protein
MISGIVASTVVLVLTGCLPLRVVTVSVAWATTEQVPASNFKPGVPDKTPVDDSAIPFGSSAPNQLTVVV